MFLNIAFNLVSESLKKICAPAEIFYGRFQRAADENKFELSIVGGMMKSELNDRHNNLVHEVLVRDSIESDFVQFDSYYKESSDDFLFSIGFNPAELKKKPPTDLERIREMNRMAPNERPISFIACEVDQKLIGMVLAIYKKETFDAVVHAHIYDDFNRRRGFASQVFVQILDLIFKRPQLSKLICEPLAENVAMNSLLQKMGLQPVHSCHFPGADHLRAGMINRYEIMREFYERLKK